MTNEPAFRTLLGISEVANVKKMVLLLVLGAAAAASAAPPSHTWQGRGETNPGNWHTAGNWSAGLVPAGGDTVIVGAPPDCEISSGKSAFAGLLKVGCGAKALGLLSIQGEDASLVASSIYVGGYGGPGKGVFTQSSGTVTAAKGLSVGHGAGVSGYGKYHGTGGTLTVGDRLSIGAGYLAASNSGNGEFHLDGATVSAKSICNGSATIKGLGRGCGLINITAGSLSVTGSFFNSHHMWAKPLPKGKKHHGRLTVSGGSVEVAGNFHNGFCSGIDTSQVEGILEVIGAGGTIGIGGNFTQIQGSTLLAELAGKDHTVIRVNGNVALAGVFKVRLAKDYAPANGTCWDIIQANPDKPGALIGTFSTLDFSAVGGAKNWQVRYDTDDGVFRVGYFGK